MIKICKKDRDYFNASTNVYNLQLILEKIQLCIGKTESAFENVVKMLRETEDRTSPKYYSLIDVREKLFLMNLKFHTSKAQAENALKIAKQIKERNL